MPCVPSSFVQSVQISPPAEVPPEPIEREVPVRVSRTFAGLGAGGANPGAGVERHRSDTGDEGLGRSTKRGQVHGSLLLSGRGVSATEIGPRPANASLTDG